MRIKNCTSEDIIIVNENEKQCCKAGETIKIICVNNTIQIKPVIKCSAFECLKIFWHKSKEDFRGIVNYIHPGFSFTYSNKIVFDSTIKELNITGYDFSLHDLVVCRMFIPKENVKTENFFENENIKRLLMLFLYLWSVPFCGVSGGLTFISACGIIFAFDWLLVISTLIFAFIFWAFFSVSKDLFGLLNPLEKYSRILEKGKHITIIEKRNHFLRYNATDFKESLKIK